MHRFWAISISVVGWAAIVAYLVVAARLCNRETGAVAVKDVRVRVLDSAEQDIITPYMVSLWLDRAGLNPRNKPVADVDTRQMQELALSRGFVKTASVYTDMNGTVNVELTQRRPVARVNTLGGHGFYVTADGWILPLQNHSTVYVPVITGDFEPPFPKDYIGPWDGQTVKEQKNMDKSWIFFSKLINFVEFISGDPFWNAQIVQINVSQRPSSSDLHGYRIEIVPRAGNHVICIGALEDVRGKLENLMVFYRKALDYQGWDAVRYIDLSYRDQVVCRK